MTDVTRIYNGGNNSVFPQNIGDKGIKRADAESEYEYGLFYDKNKGVNSAIDEGVFQGNTGDCWLLSGVLSLSYTKDGQEVIHNAIKKDNNGDYNVTFKGLGKSYKITKEELNNKNVGTLENALNDYDNKSEYSTGDDDMLLMELAVEKAVKDKDNDIPTSDGISGGSAFYLYSMLENAPTGYSYGNENGKVAKLMDYYAHNQDSSAATLGVIDSFGGLEDSHAYAIYSMDYDTTTLVNPWNSTQGIVVPNQLLLENLDKFDVSVMDMEG